MRLYLIPGFRLELVGCDDRPGMNLRYRSGDAKLTEFRRQTRGAIFQLIFVDAFRIVRRAQESGAGKFVGVRSAADDLGGSARRLRLGLSYAKHGAGRGPDRSFDSERGHDARSSGFGRRALPAEVRSAEAW